MSMTTEELEKMDELKALVARLRKDLADPPADVQEAVIRKLGLVSAERSERLLKGDFTDTELARICRPAFVSRCVAMGMALAEVERRKAAEQEAREQDVAIP